VDSQGERRYEGVFGNVAPGTKSMVCSTLWDGGRHVGVWKISKKYFNGGFISGGS